MITLCQSEGSLNEVFFFRSATVFWLPTQTGEYTDYTLHKCSEDLTKDKWLCVSSMDLTQWSEE